MSFHTGTPVGCTGDPLQRTGTLSLNRKLFPRRSLRGLLLEHRMIRSIARTNDEHGHLRPCTSSYWIPCRKDKCNLQVERPLGTEKVSFKHSSAKSEGIGNQCSQEVQSIHTFPETSQLLDAGVDLFDNCDNQPTGSDAELVTGGTCLIL